MFEFERNSKRQCFQTFKLKRKNVMLQKSKILVVQHLDLKRVSVTIIKLHKMYFVPFKNL